MTEQVVDNVEEEVSSPAEVQDKSTAETTNNDSESTESIEPVDEQDNNGYVPVSDPKVQAKIDSLYKQTKMSDARNAMLTKFMMEQQKQLDEMRGRFAQTDHAQAEKMLSDRLREARSNGDENLADRIQNEIIDFKVDMKINNAKQQAPQVQQPFSDPDERYVEFLSQETDDAGTPMRPWLTEGHPEYNAAVQKAAALSQKYVAENGQVNVPAIMKQLDNEMRKKTPQTTQTKRGVDPFSGGNLTNKRADPKLKLSDAERTIARKLGISEDDYKKNRG